MKNILSIGFVLLVILQRIGMLFITLGFFTFLLIKEPTEIQKRQYLKSKGYNEQQIDSIRNKDVTDLAYYMLLAG